MTEEIGRIRAARPIARLRVAEHKPLGAHLAVLRAGEWATWRWIALRSAGFPLERLLQLGNPACAAAADAVLVAQAAVDAAREAGLDAIRLRMDVADAPTRAELVRALQQLKKGRVAPALLSELPLLQTFASAQAELERCQAVFATAWTAATTDAVEAIYATARDHTFREALVWQNRQALHTGVDALLRKPPTPGSRGSKQRQHEALVINYLQRYCTKNDTIGFFGPVGWAYVSDDGPPMRLKPGPHLLATRNVYFDGWGLDALAETLAQDPGFTPWLIPRLLPHVAVLGSTLQLPLTPPITLRPAQAAILHACDGLRTAREIAALVLADAANELANEAQVFALLKQFQAQRRIAWQLEIPAEGLYPEQSLRQRLLAITDSAVRDPALAALERLVAARDTLAAVQGDPQALDQAMSALETTFTELTGVASTRFAGKTYAGRTLVYEDCRRDLDVQIGPAIWQRLGEPLALILQSARWFTWQTATLYRQSFRKVYDELAAKTGSRTVDFASFWLWISPWLNGEIADPVDQSVAGLQDRWAALLDLPAGVRRVNYTAAELRPRVLAAFAAPDSGWKSARYHSPDLMIAAPSVEAIQQGDYLGVMGELHPGANTIKTSLFVAQHANPAELFAATAQDLPDPQIVPVPSREAGGPTLRLTTALMSPHDYRLVFAHDSCGLPAEQSLPIGALVIEALGAQLIVRTRDGHLRFDVIDVLGELLMHRVLHHFSMLPHAEHMPRITIDQLVICREAWHFRPQDLAFATIENEAERFIAARAWAKQHDLPRFVFLKTPTEKKPFYVDFESVIAIDLLARAVRRTTTQQPDAIMTVTEMLPEPSATWLVDAAGQHYTSELRVVAVDLR